MAHLVYTDYIAAHIKQQLKAVRDEDYIVDVGPTQLDLDPQEGFLLSHKKQMIATDCNGRKYRITVEDL